MAEYNNAAAASSQNTEYIFTGGRMLAEERTGTGTTRFFHQDRLSTRLTTNSSGTVLGTQSHLPFGEALSESSEQQKWKFTTYERDSEIGDDYAINRGYWPTLGRFRQGDKIGGDISNPQSLNKYSYSYNDPLNVTDNLGLTPASLFGSYFLDASLHQYGLFIDGFEASAALFFGVLSSGAGVIGPIGYKAFSGPNYTVIAPAFGPFSSPDFGTKVNEGFLGLIDRYGPEFYNLLEEQISAINRVLREILANKKCRDFFEKAASAAVGRAVSLDETVRNTTFNGYDSTNKPSDFKTGGGNEIVRDQPVAATVGTAVYLNKGFAFGRSGIFGWVKDKFIGVDLRGTIIHELFHVAGIHDEFDKNGKRTDVVKRDLEAAIAANCL